MANIKVIVFIIGLILVTYVGGVPHDSKNFFIVQTLFITPIILDFWDLTKIKKGWIKNFFIYPVWVAGIVVLILNIVGIMGFIVIIPNEGSFTLTFETGYYFLEKIKVNIGSYFILTALTATLLFISNITLGHRIRKVDSDSKTETVNA